MKNIILLIILTSYFSFGQEKLIIQNVKLFDGHSVRKDVDVLINNGSIKKIGKVKKREYEGSSVIDGSGKTIIPGMVNCHVHAWLPYHLKNAMQAGVFAVLDMHTSVRPDSLKKLKLSDGYARFYSTGYAATVDHGHGTQYGFSVPTINENRNPEQFVEEAAARGSDYIKIIYEPQEPTLSIDQIRQIVAASIDKGLLTVAHISRSEHARSLVDLGLNGFAHMWKDAPVSSSFLDSIAAREMFVIPTVSVMEGIIEYYKSQGRQVPFSTLDILMSEVSRLSDAGIKVLAGTDPPNVGLDYGSSLHNELKLFVGGGLSPLEALKTATSNPNEVFDLGPIGIIEEGTLANFNLIDGDPLENIEEISNIESIWADGVKIN